MTARKTLVLIAALLVALPALPLKVGGDVNMQELSAGDRISVTHTEALAVEMVAQAKPAAKKTK